MMPVRREVFLLCSRRPIVAEFLLLAEILGKTDELAPVLVVPDGLAGMLPTELPAGSRVMGTGLAEWRAAGRFTLLLYILFAGLRRIAWLLRACGADMPADFGATWEALARGRSLARHVLGLGAGTAAVLMADDRDIRLDQGVLIEARRAGIFTMAVAFGKSDPDSDAVRRAQSAAYNVTVSPWLWFKRRIARTDPAVVRTDIRGIPLCFFRVGEYLALQAHGARFPVPWSYGGGEAARVAVVDRDAAASLCELGVKDGKVVVAGQCSHDILWAERQHRKQIRAVLDAEHGFAPGRPLVILALPALGEHGLTSDTDQDAEAAFLLETLGDLAQGNLLVSLHPRQRPERYRQLAADNGVGIARTALRDVLAAADLFVAYSTTIAWAQLLGIPSVALEYYGLGYTLFADQPGVAVVGRREDLRQACTDILGRADLRATMAAELASFGERIPFDGRVRDRLVAEIRAGSEKEKLCALSA